MRTPRPASRHIQRDGDSRTENWYYLDDNFITIDTEEKLTDYDPRLRPWYINTSPEPVSQVSKPYLFTTCQLPGITISYPVTNDNSSNYTPPVDRCCMRKGLNSDHCLDDSDIVTPAWISGMRSLEPPGCKPMNVLLLFLFCSQ